MSNTDDTKAPKIVDVAQPGKTAPPASSRSIIVTNRPMLKQDPMMVAPPDSLETAVPEPKPETTISRVGKPITVMIDKATSAAASTAPEVAKGAKAPAVAPKVDKVAVATKPVSPVLAEADKPKPEVPAAVEPTLTSPAEPAPPEPTTPSEQPAPPATAEAATPDEPEISSDDPQIAPNKVPEEAQRKADEEQAAKLAEQEKIIASKKYYLPIKADGNRRGLNRVLVVFVLVVLVALVWFDIVLDAGILHIGGLHPLTHFFSTV